MVIIYNCQEGKLDNNPKEMAARPELREKGGHMEGMTKEEMQRFLNREAEKGSTEYEALKALADILGIAFPELKKETK